MKANLGEIRVSMLYQTRIVDAATGKIVKQSPWEHNLILDQCLNALAKQTLATNPAGALGKLHVGSGTNPTSFPGGSVNFTQSGTTITADAPFFTSAMVGGIFKYGTDTTGVEYYISAFTDSTHVTVDTSATVGSSPGAVWQVQQTALQTSVHTSTTLQTAAGDCSTTIVGNAITLKRTFVIPQQGSSYTVNEIGWGRSVDATAVFGRTVLSSSDVIGTSNFYVVAISLTFTYTPGSPTAVGDVGTNINTAGDAMIEYWAMGYVLSTGATSNSRGNGLDESGTCFGLVATYTQNSSIQTTAIVTQGAGAIQIGATGNTWVYDSARGRMKFVVGPDSITTTGQTLRGIGIRSDDNPGFGIAFDVKFTTPVTLPSGTWQPTVTFKLTYNRVLDNAAA